MGAVYLAWDPVLERRVALKSIRLGEDGTAASAERFRREAMALAQLNHRHVCQVHDWVEARGSAYIAMDALPLKLGRHDEAGVGSPIYASPTDAAGSGSALPQRCLLSGRGRLGIPPGVTPFRGKAGPGMGATIEGDLKSLRGWVPAGSGGPSGHAPQGSRKAPQAHRWRISSPGHHPDPRPGGRGWPGGSRRGARAQLLPVRVHHRGPGEGTPAPDGGHADPQRYGEPTLDALVGVDRRPRLDGFARIPSTAAVETESVSRPSPACG